MEHHPICLPDCPDTVLTVILTVIGPIENVTLKDQRGEVKAEPAFLPVPLTLHVVPFETHEDG